MNSEGTGNRTPWLYCLQSDAPGCPTHPLQVCDRQDILSLLRIGELFLQETLAEAQLRALTEDDIKDILAITLRITELLLVYPDDKDIAMPDQAKKIIFIISRGGSRWPYLRRDEYLAHYQGYVDLDFTGALTEATRGYELLSEDYERATFASREWFCLELTPLISPTRRRLAGPLAKELITSALASEAGTPHPGEHTIPCLYATPFRVPKCPLSDPSNANISSLLRVGAAFLLELLKGGRSERSSIETSCNIITIVRRLAELVALTKRFPCITGLNVPRTVARVVQELIAKMGRTPSLRLYELIASGLLLDDVDLLGIFDDSDMDADIQPEDLKLLNKETYAWFMYDVAVIDLRPRSSFGIPRYYRAQLESTCSLVMD